MEYRRLGRSGLKVSALSLGAWVTYGSQVGDEGSYACMAAAYDAGVNFFDNAEAYASGQAEVTMGNVVKRAGWKRSDLVISTKIFWGGKGPNDRGLSRKHILEGTDAALARLQMDYVDLLFCHRPDRLTPIEETVWAMDHVVRQGKAFYWGTSEWTAAEIMEAHAVARREHLMPPVMEQPQYHMLEREKVEREYAPLYDTVGLGLTIWSPLASGVLTGKYLKGIPEGSRMSLPNMQWLRGAVEGEAARANAEKVRKLEPIARDVGATLAQLAIAWCVKNPRVSTVITGASRPEQVTENMKALEVTGRLTPEVMERIEGVLQNRPAPIEDYREM
jgi:voltage-dependent potassium channel beta subunit